MKALYDSPWHHPFLCWAAHLFFAVAFVARREQSPFFSRIFWIFALEIVTDALFTGGWTPLRSPSSLASVLSVAFVILGDFRYFLLVEYVLAGRFSLGVLARALGFALVIPVATAPLSFVDSRMLFLTYEAGFVVLALLVRFVFIPLRATKLAPDARGFLYMLTGFELVQYLGWAIADVRILAGHDLGYLIRIAPNLFYYAGFLWFAWAALPKSLRGRAA